MLMPLQFLGLPHYSLKSIPDPPERTYLANVMKGTSASNDIVLMILCGDLFHVCSSCTLYFFVTLRLLSGQC